MPFDLATAIPVKEREDGLLEKDTFDLSSAKPISEISAPKEPFGYSIPLTEEQKAQAVVELSYKEAGKKVPIGLKADWVLTSPQVTVPEKNILGALAGGGIIPLYNIAKGIANAESPNSDIGKMVFDSAYKGLAENEKVQNLGGAAQKAYPDAPWQITGAMGALAEVMMFMPSVAKLGVNVAKDVQFKIALNRARQSPKWGDLIVQISKKANKPIEVVDDDIYNKLWALRGESNPFKVLNTNLKKATGIDIFSEAGSIPITRAKVGQLVNFTDPQGLVKSGVIKSIEGERAIIGLENREIVATLSQLSLPEPVMSKEEFIKSVKSTELTTEDKELKPSDTGFMDKVAMMDAKTGEVFAYKPGEQDIYNHGDIFAKHKMNQDTVIPGFIDKKGNFVYQYPEEAYDKLETSGNLPPVKPPKTAVSGEPAPELPKKKSLSERVDITNVARERLKEVDTERKAYIRRIRKYKDDYLGEELKDLPPAYITKEGGITPDEAVAELGLANEKELVDYLKGLDKERTDLIKQIESNRPKLISKYETTLEKDKEKVKIQEQKKSEKEIKGLIKEQTKIVSKMQEQSVKDWIKATDLEIANQDLLINDYEKEISKLERKIELGEYQVEAEKANAQVKLEELKQRYAASKEARRQKQALKTEVNALIDAISKEPSGSVAIEYQQMIDNIQSKFDLKGRTEKTLGRREKMKTFVERMKVEGRPIDIPEEQLAMLDRVNLQDMTLDQLRDIKETIGRLEQLGKTKLKAREAVYEANKEKIKSKLLKEASPIKSKEIPKTPVGEHISKWLDNFIKVRNYAQKTSVGLTPIEGLADVTGMRYMKDVLDKAYSKYLTYNDELIKQWFEITKGFKQSNFDRIGVIAAANQEGGLQRLENSGITSKEVEAIKLTPEEQKAYGFILDKFKELHPLVKNYMKEVYNEDVGEVENYVSFMSDMDLMNDLEMYQRYGQTPEQIATQRTKTVEKGFTKERTKLSNIKLETDINKIFRRHIDDVAYMLNTGKEIKMFSEIVNSPEMIDKLGDVGTVAWLQWLDLMARKGGANSAQRIAGLDVLRRNIGAGVLAFRVSSALVQLSSFADTMATIGAEWASRGASSIATSPQWRNFIMDNFPEVRKAVGDDIAFREFGEGFLANFTRVGTRPLQMLDGLMRSSAASGAYQKLAKERGIKIDLKNPNEELIAEATRLMRQSQGSSFFKDQPLALTAGYGLTDNRSCNKTILTFQSFLLSRWDNINRQIFRMGIKNKDYGKAVSSVLWLLVFAAALETGIREVSKKTTTMLSPNNIKDRNLTADMALNIIQAVPLLGSLTSAMVYSSNPVPIIKVFADAIEGGKNMISGKSNKTKIKGAIKGIGALGTLGGIPGSSQTAQIIKDMIPKDKKRAY